MFPYRFGHKFILARHRVKHDEPSRFICEICAKPLSSAFNLKLHLQNHDTKTGNKVQCSFCAKWFNNAETLRSHFNARHKDQREHRCEQCDKLYPTGSALLEHVRMVHRKQPNHCCHLCDKRFFKQSVLKVSRILRSITIITLAKLNLLFRNTSSDRTVVRTRRLCFSASFATKSTCTAITISSTGRRPIPRSMTSCGATGNSSEWDWTKDLLRGTQVRRRMPFINRYRCTFLR